ncbi:MAG TPA: GDSL-type esterase/lipase family protein [Spirochaetota bacterium]|nr:GDSL-type esterase/lipase family protein [Spirochaetota bacterium]HOM38472.1 GDSL-type esterase/lipase family protein [Spirochaetota bacterium]HPQ49012.1 GDSL-type esterase/lipase family protein [Spirochaetota bacterium]
MKILAIGDSITWGYPFGPSDSWVNILNKEIKKDIIINSGINGQTFYDILKRIESEINEYNPEIIILTAGINDAFLDYSLDEINMYINRIVEIVSSYKIKIIFGIPFEVNIPYIDRKLKNINNLILKVCELNAYDYIDFRDKRITFFDECHPDKEGYKVMAEIVKNKILKLSYVKKIIF